MALITQYAGVLLLYDETEIDTDYLYTHTITAIYIKSLLIFSF